MSEDERPPIAALFQVVFDQKVGYTIAWKRSLPDVQLDGVEYQCLPSGLHAVTRDLVYFVHESYAGVSAFVQEQADQQHRNASFVAVGALVSRNHGRLGRSWTHAEALRELAKRVVSDGQDAAPLERFWDEHKDQSTVPGGADEPSSGNRKRTRSGATDYWRSGRLIESHHPALSLASLIKTFGPLTFPLYRAALLRQRILVIGSAPIQSSCNYVYDLSVLSTVPESAFQAAPRDSSASDLEPLFSVGVFDITRLQNRQTGWIACTTDDILGEKKQLYDILVELPSSHKRGTKFWPTLRRPDGTQIKATRRDYRRYGSLREELKRFRGRVHEGMRYRDHEHSCDEEEDELAPLVPPLPSVPGSYVYGPQSPTAEAVEPESWAASAYRSLVWWSSAGEMEAWEAEEAASDQALLDGLPGPDQALYAAEDIDDEGREKQELAKMLVTYFRGLTASTLQILAGIIEDTDDESEEGVEEDTIVISADDMRRIGIDTWSAGDRSFVADVMKMYFNREATVGDQGLSMCGVRIC